MLAGRAKKSIFPAHTHTLSPSLRKHRPADAQPATNPQAPGAEQGWSLGHTLIPSDSIADHTMHTSTDNPNPVAQSRPRRTPPPGSSRSGARPGAPARAPPRTCAAPRALPRGPPDTGPGPAAAGLQPGAAQTPAGRTSPRQHRTPTPSGPSRHSPARAPGRRSRGRASSPRPAFPGPGAPHARAHPPGPALTRCPAPAPAGTASAPSCSAGTTWRPRREPAGPGAWDPGRHPTARARPARRATSSGRPAQRPQVPAAPGPKSEPQAGRARPATRQAQR